VLIGYARTSTVEQCAGLEAQLRRLNEVGCEKVFQERVSSVAKRDQLAAALDYVRDGDVLVVTKLDRLARSVADLVDIGKRIEGKSASLRVLDMDLDTKTPTGRLMLNLIGSIAQFERELMLERQREGIAKAKSEGRYRGRAPTALRQAEKVRALREEGLKPEAIAERLGISRSSTYAILKEARKAA
jgi:DNA invertase Pin-like site-specific DNA recombinase